MRRSGGQYRQPGLGNGVAFVGPRIFNVPTGAPVVVPHGTSVATVQKTAATHGVTVTPKVVTDPATKRPAVMLFKGNITETPGVPVHVAVQQGVIHPTSAGTTGPATVPPPSIFAIRTDDPISTTKSLVTYRPPAKSANGNGAAPPAAAPAAPARVVVSDGGGGAPPASGGGGGGGDGGGSGGDRRGLLIAAVSIGAVFVTLSALRRNHAL